MKSKAGGRGSGGIVWQRVGASGTVSDRVETQILRMIAANELRTGERLPAERELALLIGVSRPSLREAMKSLEAQGHVRIRHGVGVFVADPRDGDGFQAALRQQEATLAELFAVREVLEVSAAGWAAKTRDDVCLQEATALLLELGTASLKKDPDYEHLQRLDGEFHMRVVEAGGNRFLNQAMQVLQAMIAEAMGTTLRLPGSLERSRVDHQQILDAALAGDSRSARTAARRHIRAARRAALGQIDSERRMSRGN